MKKNLFLMLTLLLTLGLTGCADTAKKSSSTVTNDLSAGDFTLELNGSSDDNTAGPLQTVYFDFDSSVLSSSTKSALEQNAEWLKLAKQVDIEIEGHADERGGIQYNLALGERRAKSVKDYLVALGVDAGRVSIVSYGKERPVAFGHSEEDWARNRRANFVIRAK
jgi:peptidoglycan-associated lipoprotein